MAIKQTCNATPYETLSLGIVCPMANEIGTALRFVRESLGEAGKFPFRRIVFYSIFDNACKDGSKALLEEAAISESRLQVVFAPENRCVVDAYMRGYQTALHDHCDWILEIDAGFSHHPSHIPDFLERIPEGMAVVYGTRFTHGGKIVNSSFRRQCLSRFGGILSNCLLGTKLGDMTGGFILYSRYALQKVLAHGIQSKGPFFQTEMKYHARNLSHVEVPIIYTGASHHIGKAAMRDARFHLFRLVKHRFGWRP